MSFSLRNLAFLAFASLLLVPSGCTKEPFSVSTGYVVWTGEFIDGGCGWLISFPPDIQYQPRNMPDAYLVDSLPVVVTYRDLKNRPDCLNRTDVDGQIYVHKIESPL
jgi:hypothetical protein